MIDIYLNQIIVHKSKRQVNQYNEPTYTSSNIKARFEYKRKMVRNKQGQQITSEATCYTKTQIKPDDIIVCDAVDWVVISVSDIRDINGVLSHYEAVL